MNAKDATRTTGPGAVNHANPHGQRSLYRTVLALLLAALTLFIAEAYLSATAGDDTAPQLRLNQQVQIKMLSFHLAVEELVSGDATLSPNDIHEQLTQALDLTEALIVSLKQEALQEAARVLLQQIDELGSSSGRRIADGETPGSLAEQEFDAKFIRAFGISVLIAEELEAAVNQRAWLQQLLSVLVALLLALLGLTTLLLVSRQSTESGMLKRRLASANGRTRAAHQALAVTRSHLEAYRQILLRSNDAVVITDHNNVIRQVNAAYTRMSGYQAVEAIGQTPSINKSDRHEPAFYQQMWQAINDEGCWEGEIWDRRKDGSVYPKWLRIDTLFDSEDKLVNYIATFSDLSAKKQSEENAHRQTHYDLLTKLPNRYLFGHQLQHHIASAKRSGQPLAVVSINLDRFRQINEQHGFVIGDHLLKAVAVRLSNTLRQSDEITRHSLPQELDDDTLSRVSGDEFSLLLPDLHNAEDAATVIDRVFAALGEAFHIQGQTLHVSASAGIALFPADADNEQGLLRSAELALARAKELGGGYQFYTQQMGELCAHKAEMEKRLREAIRDGLLEVHYQPIVSLQSGQVEGLEALVRWPRGEKLMNAAEFIPLAEENGLIIPLGNWVLAQACKEVAAHNAQQTRELSVSVNLSPRQFSQADLVDRVADALAQSGLQPQLLKLEITETAVMDDTEAAIEKMQQLRDLGVRLSMDDFGTGYSSLAYLKRFPVNELKIDRSFVHDLTRNEKDAEIVAAICSMGNRLHLRVVAEGVETDAQLSWLKQLECDLAQGYLIAKPGPLKELTRLQQPLAELS